MRRLFRCCTVIDTCDREIMAWCASGSGISGEMIRDLMLESVERRFGTAQTPHPSNGSRTTAVRTVPMRRSILRSAWAWCPASLRCAARNRTACRRRS